MIRIRDVILSSTGHVDLFFQSLRALFKASLFNSQVSTRLICVMLIAGLTVVPWSSAQAFTSFVAEDIQVRGQVRIDVDRIKVLAEVEVGALVDSESADRMVRVLYRSGYFSDVAVYREGETLVIAVRERATITAFEITGNKEIPTENLNKVLKQAGLAEGQVYNDSVVAQITQELRRQYDSNGRYGAKIDTKVENLPDNRVKLAITIDEGEVATIHGINIIGNKVFSDDLLRKQINLRTHAWWRLFGSSDRYSQQALAGDLEALTSYYQNRGYLNFRIESTQVSLAPDKESLYVTVNVYEGEKYTIKAVDLDGDLILPAAELRKLIAVQPGTIFSREMATESAKRISDRLGDEGYAFAKVDPVPDIDDAAHQVSIVFRVRPGNRYYVRQINFAGNFKTEDQALRREMRQLEGAVFNGSTVTRSRTRLARLPYIEQVDVKTVPVPGVADQVDVNFEVAERSAGAFQVGVGYSSSQGVMFNANVSHSNFLGTGNRISLDFVDTEFSRNYSASYTEPYYTVDGISRTISGFYRSTSALNTVSSRYTSDSYGASLRYGLPLSEYDSLRLGGSYRHDALTVLNSSTQQIVDFVNDNGDEFSTVIAQTGWVRDTRNRTVFANQGYLHRFSVDIAVPVTDLEYYTADYSYQHYYTFNKHMIGAVNIRLGYAESYADTTDIPPYEKLFAGGINSVRGFRGSSLGPVDEYDRPIGGNFRSTGQFEVFFPTLIPESKNTRFSLFLDAGQVFPDVASFDETEFRMAAGIGFQWLTPVLGMMEFALARPIESKPGDREEPFSFTFGAAF